MGRVFLAQSPGGRYVAVKVIRAELAAQPDFRIRFAREVTAARRVSGLFTAPVVDADLDAPTPWLATAYVAGPSLEDTVARHGPLPVASVLALAAGLAEGLGAIHAAGIVHRDLKPSNVLLAEDGPRVIDFGISRAAEQLPLTGTGLVIGSPGFMSPEQAQGHDVGPPSDVFSLGAVLAFAATGHGPFGSGSTAALLYRVVFAPPATDALPARIRPLVERCLAKDPRQRPSPAELLSDLNAHPTAGWLPAPMTHGPPTHPPTATGMAGAPSARLLPDSPMSVGPRNRRRRLSRNVIIAILGVATLALSGVSVALTLIRSSATTGVTLEPVGSSGHYPFMRSVGTDQRGVRQPAGSGGPYSGGAPGLYGGTMRKASCNQQQLVSFLRTHPDKGAAWASVFGIQPADIPGYVANLTSVVLRTDTAVINHGYVDGHVTSFPAILQAGTAVLIDQHGLPVTKCFCGNPLSKPTAYTQVTYTGERWDSFSPTTVTYIQQTTVIEQSITVVNLDTGGTFRRQPHRSDQVESTQPVTSEPPRQTTSPPPSSGGTSNPSACTSTQPAGTSTPSPCTSTSTGTTTPSACTSTQPAGTSIPSPCTSTSTGTSTPSTGTSGPSTGTSGPSTGTSGPSTGTSGPPAGTSGPPAGTQSSPAAPPPQPPSPQVPVQPSPT